MTQNHESVLISSTILTIVYAGCYKASLSVEPFLSTSWLRYKRNKVETTANNSGEDDGLQVLYVFQAFAKHADFSSVQSLSRVRLFVTSWTAARQASLSITNSWSLLKLTSIESVMPSNHLILCHPLLLLPSIFPSIRVFSSESVLHIRWPKY